MIRPYGPNAGKMLLSEDHGDWQAVLTPCSGRLSTLRAALSGLRGLRAPACRHHQ